jgi:uncharacterized protein (TIGR02594 family)
MAEPRWLKAARANIGERELAGRKHNPKVLQWWTLIRAPFTDDETPWCAGFVGAMLESVGIKSSRSAAARSYVRWGRKLDKPVPGCVVVFERGPRNGHVGFFVGYDSNGNLRILGGNQGDEVNIKSFAPGRVLPGGYRWPEGEPVARTVAPVEDIDEPVSRREGIASLPSDDDPGGESEAYHPTSLWKKVTGWISGASGGAGLGVIGYLTDPWVVVAVGAMTIIGGLIAFILWWHFVRRRSLA